jgi:peptidoglycan-associated lipoprotein
MNKFNKKLGLTLIYGLSILFISGCTGKNDVVIEDKSIVEQMQPEQNTDENMNNNMKITDNVIKVDDKYSYINVVTSDINSQKVSLKSIHFDFDKYSLTDKMREITKENYTTIQQVTSVNKHVKIKLEGNCDEFGTDEYNYALGLKRAKTVKDVLINDGISEDRIVLVSFGESNPICSNKTNNCYKKNRRVDYRLLP